MQKAFAWNSKRKALSNKEIVKNSKKASKAISRIMQHVHEGKNKGAVKMIEIGRLILKIAGRDANKKGLIVDVIDDNYVLIDGQVRRRKCNIKHIEPLDKVLKLSKNASHEEVKSVLKEINIEITDAKPKEKKEKPKKIRKSILKKEKLKEEEKAKEKEVKNKVKKESKIK